MSSIFLPHYGTDRIDEKETNYKIDEAEFWKTLKTQDFSLPKPTINYLLKNFKSPKIYQKLLECCKYFYSQRTFIVLNKVYNKTPNEWFVRHFHDKTSRNHNKIYTENFDIENIWFAGSLEILDYENVSTAAEIILRIQRHDLKILSLGNQNLLFNEFCKLTPKIEECNIYECEIRYNADDENEVPLEIIFESLPCISEFRYFFIPEEATNFTPETMKKIENLSTFQNLNGFKLARIPTHFNISSFYNKIKERKSNTKFCFEFWRGMPANFQNQITALNCEILKNVTYDFVPPLFNFPEMDRGIWRNITELQHHHFLTLNCPIPEDENISVKLLFNFIWWMTFFSLHFTSIFWYKYR